MRNPETEALLREALADQPRVTETPMFGGLAFLVGGHLTACASHEGLLVRLGKGRDGWALDLPGAAPLLSGTRPMEGWVRLPPDFASDPAVRARSVAAALDFVATLPPR
jgi:hypothetical protein